MTTYLPLSSADDVDDNKDEQFFASLSDPASVPRHVRAPPPPSASRRTRLLVATNLATGLLALASPPSFPRHAIPPTPPTSPRRDTWRGRTHRATSPARCSSTSRP